MAEILKSDDGLRYVGNKQPALGELDSRGMKLSPYIPSDELVEAVNLAITLERPLLLKGEPGCGKTQLARAVAYELKLEYEFWPIKSTTTASEGLYTYDAVGRLRDSQLASSDIDKDAVQRAENAENYIDWGPLGRAFRKRDRTVLLIDEIDKADIDFPNDLLLELDEKRFVVNEVKTSSTLRENIAIHNPIIFITSNDEKELPDAFLRRCLFFYVNFPDKYKLQEIVNLNFPDLSSLVLDAAIARFLKLRNDMSETKEFQKKVSTSELLDWVNILRRYPEDDVLKKLDGRLPFTPVLLKSWEDHIRYVDNIAD